MSDERCDEMRLLVQADLDGELTAADAVRIGAHLECCSACADVQAKLAGLSARLRSEVPYYPASDALRHAVRSRVIAEGMPVAPARKAKRPAAFGSGPAFASGFALAACLMVLIVPPRARDPADMVVAAHVRALLPGHLMDVASTDQHTVKPWFDGRLPFAPPVKDLKAVGFPLIGGRLDYLAGHMAAALVYRHDAHEINLFVWPDKGSADGGASHGSVDGYNFERWTRSGMTFWAVSDLNARDLSDFNERWNAS
jgi:anti-sigma factor RsiW